MSTMASLGACLLSIASAAFNVLDSQTPPGDERPYRDRERARAGYERLSAAYADYERKHGGWIVTGNGRLHYLRWGTRGAPALVWLHGSYSNAYELHPFADSLVALGIQVIAIDYYGHGLTPVPRTEKSVYDAADDVGALMDSLGIHRAIIGGWSRGGVIASAMYQSHRDRVSGLIFVDGGSFAMGKSYSGWTNEQISALFGRPASACTPLACEEGFPDRFDLFWTLFRERRLPGLRDELLLVDMASMSSAPDGKWRIRPGLQRWLWEDSLDRFTALWRRPWDGPLFQRSMDNHDPAVALRRLDVPVLIVDPVGDPDQFPVSADNEALRAMKPDLVRHVSYEKTSHDAMRQRPSWFLRDVRELVHRVLSRESARTKGGST